MVLKGETLGLAAGEFYGLVCPSVSVIVDHEKIILII